MTKAISCTLVGRLIHDGWLESVHDPAPAPLWRDPRSIHRLITLDHLLRMRSGLGMPVRHEDGRVTVGFENSAVYQEAGDAFDAGFVAAWLSADRATTPAVLRRAVVAGHRAAARQLATPRPELAPVQ